jgi:DNA mismatch repair protein MutS
MIKHVSIAYNNDNVLIYTHKIEDGKCKRNYGLEIAQKVLNLENFTERTNELFNEITKKSSRKPSKYNKNVLVEKCEICNCTDNLHTHHIIFQKQFHENSSEKNTKGNLVILCEKHHIMTHQNKLVINGWVQSLEGRYLDYILI